MLDEYCWGNLGACTSCLDAEYKPLIGHTIIELKLTV